MIRKYHWIRALKLLSLAAALAASLWFLQKYLLCYSDNNTERLTGFYLEDKDSIDVILIGASEVYSDFSSCYAYEKFGYTSYPVATTGNIAPSYKTQLKTAIKQQHPKMVVIEINGMLYADDEDYAEEGRFRKYADNIPHDSDWEELVTEYAGDRMLEYRVPILKYHSVWKDPHAGVLWMLAAAQDKRRGYSCLKGTKTRAEVYSTSKTIYNDSLKNCTEKEALNGIGEKYLRELLEYCRDEGLENVVFVRFPHIIIKRRLPLFYRSNAAAELIREYGYDYISFELNYEESGLDMAADFYDLDHLNIYGQQKFTEYLGRYLQENYGISRSSLTDSQQKKWEICRNYYDAFSRYTASMAGKKWSRDVGEDAWDMIWMRRYL